MSINIDHDTAWEDIQNVIQEIEKAALESRSRTDILFYNYATLEQGKHVVHMGIDSCDGLAKAREGANETSWDGDLIELMGMFDSRTPDPNKPWSGSAGDVAGKYLQECFGCSFRMAFDYQLNPLSLIGPVLESARTIASAAKRIEEALDPMKVLAEVCSFMEQLKIFCPQDLATVLMSLKMLIKSYAMQAFNIKLDWTVILGPILKAISELLIAIIDSVLNIALAPMDCAIGALRSAEQLERSARGLAGAVSTTGERFKSSTADSLHRVVTIRGTPVREPTQRQQYGLGSITGQTEKGGPAYSGFAITVGQALDEAILDPAWSNASVLQKSVVSVTTAREKLVNVFDNLKLTLDSLSQLVSGGLALSLNFGSLLLSLFDLIGLIMMIIRMFNKVPDFRNINWCEYLAQNPDILREQLEKQYGQSRVQLKSITGVVIPDTISYSVLVNGSVVGDIPLCASSRDPSTAAFLNKWIQELGSGS